jgi:transcriptional regulator with XRE-family HTH domain
MAAVESLEQLVELVRTRHQAKAGRARAIREAAGVSGREMAEALDVDPVTLWRWENGLTRPRRDAALRWARALASLKREVRR